MEVCNGIKYGIFANNPVKIIPSQVWICWPTCAIIDILNIYLKY